jgi:hypothetical protein
VRECKPPAREPVTSWLVGEHDLTAGERDELLRRLQAHRLLGSALGLMGLRRVDPTNAYMHIQDEADPQVGVDLQRVTIEGARHGRGNRPGDALGGCHRLGCESDRGTQANEGASG